MSPAQESAVMSFVSGELDEESFLRSYGVDRNQIVGEIFNQIESSALNKSADSLDYALLMANIFAFESHAKALVTVFHELLPQYWHQKHEDMIQFLQLQRMTESVAALRAAIALKPKLEYLEYDDYGSYYKKCLCALAAIGTGDAVEIIRECTKSEDLALREQALYRLSKVKIA
jgi:hypothetical protein